MKKSRLFAILILLIIVCLSGTAASFKQCSSRTSEGSILSEDSNTNKTGDSNTTSAANTNSIENDKSERNNNINSNTSGTEEVSLAEIETPKTNSGSNTQKDTAGVQKFAIVVSGISYNSQQYGWFLGSTALAYKLLKNNGYTDKNIYYLFEDKNEPDVDYLSTLSNFIEAVRDIKSMSGDADTVIVILIGHGGFNGTNSYYCLSDSNLYDIELSGMFEGLRRDKLIFVFSPCNSGGFVDDLSGSNTVIITSTRKDEANRAAFIEPFLAAFDGPGDADADGRVSFAEAFIYASDNVKQQYIDNNWGPLTEHSQIDDNGDNIGSEELKQNDGDGKLAGQIFLGYFK